MKYVCVIICFFGFIKLPAQSADIQIIKGQDSLRQIKVDTFLVYNIDCVGYVTIDSCASNSKYLFWRQNGNSFVRKFNQCYTYNAELIVDNDPLVFFGINKLKIVKEKIKKPTYIVRRGNGKSDQFSVFIDHSCFYELTITSGAATINKSVSEYDLNFKKFDNGKMNINYKYNQSTASKKIIDIIDSCIHKLYSQH